VQRDASCGPSTYSLMLVDCLRGIHKVCCYCVLVFNFNCLCVCVRVCLQYTLYKVHYAYPSEEQTVCYVDKSLRQICGPIFLMGQKLNYTLGFVHIKLLYVVYWITDAHCCTLAFHIVFLLCGDMWHHFWPMIAIIFRQYLLFVLQYRNMCAQWYADYKVWTLKRHFAPQLFLLLP